MVTFEHVGSLAEFRSVTSV